AFRPDLADRRLEGKVAAARYAEGRPARIGVPVADVRSAPRADAGLDTQFLHGDDMLVFDDHEGWAWVQSVRDRYVGYVETAALAFAGTAPTHRVAAPRTFVYGGPDLKRPTVAAHSMGAELAVAGFEEARGTV